MIALGECNERAKVERIKKVLNKGGVWKVTVGDRHNDPLSCRSVPRGPTNIHSPGGEAANHGMGRGRLIVDGK